jgi:hypothetical protein
VPGQKLKILENGIYYSRLPLLVHSSPKQLTLITTEIFTRPYSVGEQIVASKGLTPLRFHCLVLMKLIASLLSRFFLIFSRSSSSSSFSLCLFQASDFFFFTFGSFRHLVGLLGRGISPAPRSLPTHRTTQHRKTQTHIHVTSRIRTCYPNVRAAEDSTCLRLRGYWDRLYSQDHTSKILTSFVQTCKAFPFIYIITYEQQIKPQVEVFLTVTLCSVVVGYQRFRGPCCFYVQSKAGSMHGPLKRWYPTTKLHSVTVKKTSTWNITAMKASKLWLSLILGSVLLISIRLYLDLRVFSLRAFVYR